VALSLVGELDQRDPSIAVDVAAPRRRPLIRIHPERIVSWGVEGEERRSRDVA
jgi:hypothetical protein